MGFVFLTRKCCKSSKWVKGVHGSLEMNFTFLPPSSTVFFKIFYIPIIKNTYLKLERKKGKNKKLASAIDINILGRVLSDNLWFLVSKYIIFSLRPFPVDG